MNHTPTLWETWEVGAGNIWIGYTDATGHFKIPCAEALWKGREGKGNDLLHNEAKVLAKSIVIALNSHAALVAACRTLEWSVPYHQPKVRGGPTAQCPVCRGFRESGHAADCLLRDALAATGETA